MLRPTTLAIVLLAGCGKSAPDAGAKVAPTKGGPTTVAPQVKKPIDKTPLPPLAANTGASTGTAKWALGFGGLGIEAPRALVIADTGDAYMAGYVEGDAEFGAVAKHTAGAKSDAFVAKISPDGKLVWAQAWGGEREDVASGVAVNAKAVLVVGNFTDTLSIGEFKRDSAGNDDAFVAAFDLTGHPNWILSGGGIDSDGMNAAVATPDGGWVVGGSFSDTATFADHTLTSTGHTDAVLMKLDPGGNIEWIRQFGGRDEDTILHLAIDARGAVFVQGAFKNVATWGGEALAAAGGADEDIVLVKLDANGDHVWSRRFGSQFDDVPGGIAVDPSGAVSMTGAFEKVISFGESDEHTSIGESDVFVARFTNDGGLQWVQTFGGERPDIGFGIAADAQGNTVTTGWFEGMLDFGKGVATTSKGNKDVFALKLDASGKTVWVQTFGDKDHDQGRVVAMDAAGNAYVGGLFRFQLAIAATAIESNRAEGDRIPKPDTFLVRFDR